MFYIHITILYCKRVDTHIMENWTKQHSLLFQLCSCHKINLYIRRFSRITLVLWCYKKTKTEEKKIKNNTNILFLFSFLSDFPFLLYSIYLRHFPCRKFCQYFIPLFFKQDKIPNTYLQFMINVEYNKLLS